jgi:hypothetical protein
VGRGLGRADRRDRLGRARHPVGELSHSAVASFALSISQGRALLLQAGPALTVAVLSRGEVSRELAAAAGLATAPFRSPAPVSEDVAEPDPLVEILGFDMPAAPTVARMLGDPLPDMFFLTAVTAGILVHLAGVHRLRRNGRHRPVARTLSWSGGMLLLAAITGLGVARPVRVHAVQRPPPYEQVRDQIADLISTSAVSCWYRTARSWSAARVRALSPSGEPAVACGSSRPRRRRSWVSPARCRQHRPGGCLGVDRVGLGASASDLPVRRLLLRLGAATRIGSFHGNRLGLPAQPQGAQPLSGGGFVVVCWVDP